MSLRIALLSLALASACGGTSTTETPPSPAPTPTQAEPTPTPEPTPDPAPPSAGFDEAAARREASRVAREAFAARTDIVDAAGHRVTLADDDFMPEDFMVRTEEGGWHLWDEPPAGQYARVWFDSEGHNPRVEVGFATQ